MRTLWGNYRGFICRFVKLSVAGLTVTFFFIGTISIFVLLLIMFLMLTILVIFMLCLVSEYLLWANLLNLIADLFYSIFVLVWWFFLLSIFFGKFSINEIFWSLSQSDSLSSLFIKLKAPVLNKTCYFSKQILLSTFPRIHKSPRSIENTASPVTQIHTCLWIEVVCDFS